LHEDVFANNSAGFSVVRDMHSPNCHRFLFFFLNIIYIFGYKQTWPSTILVVSHDREFLNTIATDVVHLHSQRIDAYHGDYDSFVKTKTERLKNQQREYDAQKEYREHIQVGLSLLKPLLLMLSPVCQYFSPFQWTASDQ